MKRRPSAAVRRVALVALCASSLAAACSFPGVTFDEGGVGDGTTGSDASLDSTTGDGSVGFDTGGGDEGVTGTDAAVGADVVTEVGADVGEETGVDAGADAVAPVDAAADVSNPADTGMPHDAGQDAVADTGAPKDSGGADGPNCNCSAGSMIPTVMCTSVAGLDCMGAGFMGTVACGTSATYYTCGSTGILTCGAIPGA